MGSGTTLIAAETTGRVCLGIELNPAYVDVAVERWQRFTGKAAVLDGSGESFDDLEGQTPAKCRTGLHAAALNGYLGAGNCNGLVHGNRRRLSSMTGRLRSSGLAALERGRRQTPSAISVREVIRPLWSLRRRCRRFHSHCAPATARDPVRDSAWLRVRADRSGPSFSATLRRAIRSVADATAQSRDASKRGRPVDSFRHSVKRSTRSRTSAMAAVSAPSRHAVASAEINCSRASAARTCRRDVACRRSRVGTIDPMCSTPKRSRHAQFDGPVGNARRLRDTSIVRRAVVLG